MHQRGVSLRAAFDSIHPWVAGFAAFASAGLICAGPGFIRCLFKPEYQEAAWMLQVTALGGWVTMLQVIAGSLLWVAGNARGHAASSAVKLLVLPPLIWAGYRLDGFRGMLWGFVTAEVVRYGLTVWALREQGLPFLRYDLWLGGAIAAAWVAASRAGSLFPLPGQRWPQFAAECLPVVGLWLGLAVVAYCRRPRVPALRVRVSGGEEV
jgi:O-antigen/teichoic acid export membrane protein